MKPKAKATVVKSVKVEPEMLYEIENDPRYTDFSAFTRDALAAYIEAMRLIKGGAQGRRLTEASSQIPAKKGIVSG